MRRYELTDEQYTRVAQLLPGRAGSRSRPAFDNQQFLNAVVWIARSGSAWRDLPERFGKWNSVYQRFRRWAKQGRWQQIFEALQAPDLDWTMLDTTVIRAHQHAAGARKKGEAPPRSTKRSDARAVG